MQDIAESGIGVYAGANWDEGTLKASPGYILNNLPPKRAKMIMGPYTHCDWAPTEFADRMPIQLEQLRFFDYWLKGIENGVMDEPPVLYFTYNAPKGREWRQAAAWPLPNEQRTSFFLDSASLTTAKPSLAVAAKAVLGAPANNRVSSFQPVAGGARFETATLEREVEVTGNPAIELWLSGSSADTDIVARLEDVAPDGTAVSYHMIGQQRASRRKPAAAPYRNMGLPYSSNLESDVVAVPKNRPYKVSFAMLPMSYIFPKGHRIRLTITASNPRDLSDRSELQILGGGERASLLTLPLIPSG